MKGRLGKFGIVFLALALVLSVTGAAFASWTDKVTIDGTVNTGEVNLEVVALSSTYVYKVPTTHECIILYELADLEGTPLRQYVTDCDYSDGTWYEYPEVWTPPGGAFVVASSVATPGAPGADDEVIVNATNLFPCICFGADILLHYDGIPARIVDAEIDTEDEWLLDLIANEEAGVAVFKSDEFGHLGDEIVDVLGYQLHECDWIMVIMGVHIPQDDAYMGLSGSFTGELEVIQWNEYPD